MSFRRVGGRIRGVRSLMIGQSCLRDVRIFLGITFQAYHACQVRLEQSTYLANPHVCDRLTSSQHTRLNLKPSWPFSGGLGVLHEPRNLNSFNVPGISSVHALLGIAESSRKAASTEVQRLLPGKPRFILPSFAEVLSCHTANSKKAFSMT